MLQNYFKIAVRTLWKEKGYAFINVFGLAVGIACCVLIALFVRSEWSFDRFHERSEDLYRMWGREFYSEEQDYFYTVTQPILGPTLRASFPEVENFARISLIETRVLREEAEFLERIHVVDTSFFNVFSFPLLQGNRAQPFPSANSIILSETVATRYFGTRNPLGEVLTLDLNGEMTPVTVSGIAADPPTASSIQYELLLPYEISRQYSPERLFTSWTVIEPETYVLLRPGTDPATLEAKFPAMVRQAQGENFEEGVFSFGLQPITDIHLNPDYPLGHEPTSDPAYAYILLAIAFFVLGIACINFMTLAIGRSTTRAREVGVRKAVGARRGQVMAQFWGEALLLAGLALVLGLALAQVALPVFNNFVGRELVLAFDGGILLLLTGLIVLIGLVAGGYPALLLSGFRPTQVLKGQITTGVGASRFRQALVVVQFGLSIFLVVSTLLMRQQLDYLQDRPLGFEKEQLVFIPTGIRFSEGMPAIERIRGELAGTSGVQGVAGAAMMMGMGSWMAAGYTGTDGIYREYSINLVDPHYLDVMDMEIVEGRGFSAENPADARRALIVNEAFAEAYGRTHGWTTALGQRIPGEDYEDHEIIGVVRDFNFASLHNAVEPLVLAINPQIPFSGASDSNSGQPSSPKLIVRIQPDNITETLASVETTWREVLPDVPFDYQFLDATLGSQYRAEQQLGQIVSYATLLAILIACLGLFGLATLAVARRTKEIGVRKVLGASAAQVALLLCKDFARLIVIAAVLAAPLAYFAMDDWLADFVYRIDIDAGVFLVASLLVLVVALLTVSYHALRAAFANPVHALRYE